MQNRLIDLVEKANLRADAFKFEVGDTVDVHCRILEGDKERIQIFNGVVIAKRGSGTREMFTVRRIVAGEGVERTFPINSPKIAKLDRQAARPRPSGEAVLSSRTHRQGGPADRTPARRNEVEATEST